MVIRWANRSSYADVTGLIYWVFSGQDFTGIPGVEIILFSLAISRSRAIPLEC